MEQVYVFSDYVLRFGKMHQNPQSNTVWDDKFDVVQECITIQNFGQMMVSQCVSSGISQDSPHCSTATKSKSSCQKWAMSLNNLQHGSPSCSTTCHGDLKTMNRNANLTRTSFLFMREGFHQEDGHSSDLDKKRSGILLTTKDPEENGKEALNWWWWSNSEKANTQFSEPWVYFVPKNGQKQMRWKMINTFLRWWVDWKFSHNYFR